MEQVNSWPPPIEMQVVKFARIGTEKFEWNVGQHPKWVYDLFVLDVIGYWRKNVSLDGVSTMVKSNSDFQLTEYKFYDSNEDEIRLN